MNNMVKIRSLFLFTVHCSLLTLLMGCAGIGGSGKKLRVLDLAEDRIADLTINQHYAGRKELLFFSMGKTADYLEGYIQGIVTDYQDNPIQGVIVRASPLGEKSGKSSAGDGTSEPGKTFESTAFDAGVSDTNGMYRIRFSVPIVRKQVDIRGTLQYNPGWEQMKTNLGKSYEPQMKETPFRLFYDAKSGLLAFSEGIRKLIVQPVTSDVKPRREQLPGATAPLPAKKEEKTEKKGGEEDLFKGFDFNQ
ncbi:MAG: hypothetical protein HY399_00210 [Elusimicrobia bacterium]|nr:hypothetical protein [Elusimicrobiota bacterium]